MIRRKLGDHKASLQRLENQLKVLCGDYRFLLSGGNIIYTVDFCELCSFLKSDKFIPSIDNIGLGENNSNEAQYEYQLGLKYLFHDKKPIILLEPYTSELWNYLHFIERNFQIHTTSLRKKCENWLKVIPSERRSLFHSLTDEITNDEAKSVLDLMRDDGLSVCYDVISLFGMHDKNDNIYKSLNAMIKNNIISFDYNYIFSKIEVGKNIKYSNDECLEIYNLFPEKIRKEKPLQKMRDARAILLLRNINNNISKDYKFVLITRDKHIKNIARTLADSGDEKWKNIRGCFRNIESIFLDLILKGTGDKKERLELIEDTGKLLNGMLKSVNELLESNLYQKEKNKFFKLGNTLIDDSWKKWTNHRNLRLSLAVASEEWLKDDLNDRSHEKKLKEDVHDSINEARSLIIPFIRFLGSTQYLKIANENAYMIKKEIFKKWLGVLFIGRMADEKIEEVTKAIMGEYYSVKNKTVLTGTPGTVICSLQFISSTYQEYMKKFIKIENEELSVRQKRISDSFIKVALKSADSHGNAESGLFMAYILGLLNFWDEAALLAEYSLQFEGIKLEREFHYFLAIAKRRAAHSGNVKLIESYISAYKHIMTAIELRSKEKGHLFEEDPRYLKERATIALLYHEENNNKFNNKYDKVINDENHPQSLNYQDAVKALEKALSFAPNDRRLRIEILNNLAYLYVVGPNQNIKDAMKLKEKIEKEFNEAKIENEVGNVLTPWLAIKDTLLMIDALYYKSQGDKLELEKIRNELKRLCEGSEGNDFGKTDIEKVKNNINTINKWIEDLKIADGFDD